MPKKRRRLSQSKVNVRRRARYAELRAERAPKSIAQRMRDANTIALQQQQIGWQQKRIRDLERQVFEREDREKRFKVMIGELSVKEYLSPEDYEAAIKSIAELHFREFTPEEKLARMRSLWREVDALLSVKPGRKVRDELILWVQRNGFDLTEFWAEYRRRKG